MTTTPTAERRAWWQLWLAPVFVVACCGSGLIAALAGVGSVAALVLNPVLVVPAAVVVWLVASRVRRRSRSSDEICDVRPQSGRSA